MTGYVIGVAVALSAAAILGLRKWVWPRMARRVRLQWPLVWRADSGGAGEISTDTAQRRFLSRTEATPPWLSDLALARHTSFVGITHSSLADYLAEVIDSSRTNSRNIRWRGVDVVFARTDVGQEWAGQGFNSRLEDALRAIARTVTTSDAAKYLPDLTVVNFRQSQMFQYIGGTFMAIDSPVSADGSSPYDLAYVVSYMPYDDRETKSSFTTRLSRDSDAELLDKYERSNKYMQRRSRLLFSLDPTDLWNRSVAPWREFEDRYQLYPSVVEQLWDYGEFLPSHHVLDLGCGAGGPTAEVAQRLTAGKLVAVDSSPQMVESTVEKFRQLHMTNASAVVGSATLPLYGSLSTRRFDRIISTFALQEMRKQGDDLTSIFRLWRNWLKDDGRLVLALHNGVIETPAPDGFKDWDDPFRRRLVDEIRQSVGSQHLRPQQPKMTLFDIRASLTHVGFSVLNEHGIRIDRTMQDRMAMWRVPAVLDSLVDVRAAGAEIFETILGNVASGVAGQRTMPTTVTLLQAVVPARPDKIAAARSAQSENQS